MTKPNKFWDLRSAKDEKSADLFIYGAIVSGYKWNEADITITEFTQAMDNLPKSVKTLNMYVNSPGGSVFTTIAMMNQLERKRSSLTINAYVDGVAASAASFLIMKADNIYMYKNTFLMIHKPMISLWGANAVDCREQADWLDKTELKTCRPAYLSKGTVLLTEDKVSELLDGKDNWLDADEAAELFNITVLEEEKDAVACADMELLQSYNGIPAQLLNPHQSSKTSSLNMTEREKIAVEAKAGATYIETILGGIYQ
ncbi:head maturation protease, ClpP-related [Brevibacillus sp. DP1.3A]|uniref:head maturation protease, ClpP-related n=1 Tax=Brevibacillus sp. DP1.3A TaxID=2738867 RepID=UPI00156B327E|nr:head maturation protease, ClpP-related [Brevibacillus sp. DP1.3A]UED78043.1 Clp protease ClpP [Brevibacillus sp. DP1.3A]